MKNLIIIIFTSLTMFGLGWYFSGKQKQISNEHVIYATEMKYFGYSVDDDPKLQRKLLETAEAINVEIEKKTGDFLGKHRLMMDFDAVFIPLAAGNYRVRVLCSNRNEEVEALYEEYQTLIDTCTAPYDELIEKANEPKPPEIQNTDYLKPEVENLQHITPKKDL